MSDRIEKERTRIGIQTSIDSSRSQKQRNEMGQFATPPELAFDIVYFSLCTFGSTHPSEKVDFLDPAIGTGAFFSALLKICSEQDIGRARGFEIDTVLAHTANSLWNEFVLEVQTEDFTRVKIPESENDRANLIICNPPYIRHHHINATDKPRLQDISKKVSGIDPNGLSGMYCYFILISHAWLKEYGIAAWLIPSEFMDVKYGLRLKEYLTKKVRLLRIHRFDPSEVQFQDALVSSSVIFFQKTNPSGEDLVDFSFGGSISNPKTIKRMPISKLKIELKWSSLEIESLYKEALKEDKCQLNNYFDVRRGLATGANGFFIVKYDRSQELGLPDPFLIPILPSPRNLKQDEIESNNLGSPINVEHLVLINCNLPEEEVQANYPKLWEYYNLGLQTGVNNHYLNRNREPWYSQEKRYPAPILCTYMGRVNGANKVPFRFILNHSNAIATNSYLLLYPKGILKKILVFDPNFIKEVWMELKKLTALELTSEGRVYGGGLHKLEPKELANVRVSGLARLINKKIEENAHKFQVNGGL